MGLLTAEETSMITVPRRYRCRFPNTLALGTKKKPAIPTPSKCQPVNNAICVRLLPKYNTNVKVFAASNGDNVDAITDNKHKMPVIRSLRHRGQLSGSFASLLGCGIKMIPSLLRFTLVCCGAPASSSRSSSVAVPDRRTLAVHAPRTAQSGFRMPSTHREHAATWYR